MVCLSQVQAVAAVVAPMPFWPCHISRLCSAIYRWGIPQCCNTQPQDTRHRTDIRHGTNPVLNSYVFLLLFVLFTICFCSFVWLTRTPCYCCCCVFLFIFRPFLQQTVWKKCQSFNRSLSYELSSRPCPVLILLWLMRMMIMLMLYYGCFVTFSFHNFYECSCFLRNFFFISWLNMESKT